MQHPHDSLRPAEAGGIFVQHRVEGFSENWLLWDEHVPESAWHSTAVMLLYALLQRWVEQSGRNAAVFSDLAVRVLPERPSVGFSPDLMVVDPAPPGARDLSSLRLWESGHVVPAFVLEVVSPGHPHKDYVDIPDQCAAVGVRELVIFDPVLAGPKAHGGPHRLQVWRRTDTGLFARAEAGDGPLASEFLGAYLLPVDEGRVLRVSSTPHGAGLWPTPEEAERAEKERAYARIAELEAELRKRGPQPL